MRGLVKKSGLGQTASVFVLCVSFLCYFQEGAWAGEAGEAQEGGFKAAVKRQINLLKICASPAGSAQKAVGKALLVVSVAMMAKCFSDNAGRGDKELEEDGKKAMEEIGNAIISPAY